MRLPKTSATRWLCTGIALVCGLALLVPAAFNPQSARAATIVVDNFSTFQTDVAAHPDPDVLTNDDSSSVSGTGILGGERDLRAEAIVEQLESPNRGIYAGVANGRFEASSQQPARGTITVQWDGADGDPVNLDATGLNGVDLTDGGTDDAFLVRVTRDTSDASGLTFTVYSDAGNYSSFDLDTLHTTSTVDYIVKFDEFTAASGSGADFTDVGAITFSFSYHEAGGVGPYINVLQTTQSDRRAPQTTVSLSGTAGTNNWYTSAVQVTLNATDNASGVAETVYSLDGGDFQSYSAPFTISTDGQHTVQFYSTDLVSNTEDTQTTSVNIDKTAPTAMTGGPFQVSEGSSVILDGSSSTDALSGIDTITWALNSDGQFDDANPASFSGVDGPASATVSLQVTDLAGNVSTVDTTVTVNNLAPEIHSVTNDGPPVYGSLVNVTVDASDLAGLLDPLSYAFDCDGDLTYEVGPQSENTASCDIGVQEGGLMVNVRVTDGDGGEALGATVISVPTEMCANRYTGALRYSADGCQSHETAITLTSENAITVCVSTYTDVLRYLQRGTCSWSETRVELPDDGPLVVCVSRYTQVMRAADSVAQCQPFEAGHIIGNSSGSTPSDGGNRRAG